MLVAPAFGISNYHALVLSVEKRFAAGFNFLSTYTWSKFLNDANDGGGFLGAVPDYANYYDRDSDYGPSGNDIRHRLTISSVYELPVGSGKRYLAKGALGKIAGNWSIGVLALMQTGPPSTVRTQTDTTNAFPAGPQRADLLRDPNLKSSERTLTRWFDTSAFAQPATFTFGTSGRGVIRADGVINFDLSLLKNFFYAEQKGFQFRLEMFNAFNHPDFGLPGIFLNGSGFGVVSSARGGRNIQVGLRLVF